jgi:hypothetical protein
MTTNQNPRKATQRVGSPAVKGEPTRTPRTTWQAADIPKDRTVVVLAAFTLWGQNPDTLGLDPSTVTVEHVEMDGGDRFAVKRDGETVSKLTHTFGPAIFVTATDAMAFALEMTGWAK